jgi:hypothetical protein
MDNMEKDKEEYLEFLDYLRDSGVTNMFGAVPYLLELFPELNKMEAKRILVEWMETYQERHPHG